MPRVNVYRVNVYIDFTPSFHIRQILSIRTLFRKLIIPYLSVFVNTFLGFFGDEIKNRRKNGGFDCFGGGRWIRTIEARRNRFTVCPLWPLGNPSGVYQCAALSQRLYQYTTPFMACQPFFYKKTKNYLYRYRGAGLKGR